MRKPNGFIRRFLVCGWTTVLWWLGCFPIQAQHEADTWYFGNKAGLRFTDGTARPLLDGQLVTTNACAVQSDPTTGDLLFYTNGETIWDRTHQVMPNGEGLFGFSTVTQGALIVPVPGVATQYYVFSLLQRTQPVAPGGNVYDVIGTCQLSYAVVDLVAAPGRGTVTRKNVVLADHLTEKLTAVRHANGHDYWLLAHVWGSNDFLVYPLTAAGIGPPQHQAIGPTHPAVLADTVAWQGTAGYLVASPNGRHLATTMGPGTEPLMLFDFDAATGGISRPLQLGRLLYAYGVCFSPDNSKLYVQNFSRNAQRQSNVLSQYDLRTGDTAAVVASGQSIIAGNPDAAVRELGGSLFYALQNGPDGRLYGASRYHLPGTPEGERGDYALYVINRPNASGYTCQVQAQVFDFASRTFGPGLPTFLQHTFNGLEPRAPVAAECAAATLQLYPNPTTGRVRLQLAGHCALPATQVTIYSAIGQQVGPVQPVGADASLSVAALAPGLYWLEIRLGTELVHQRLVKQ